LPDEPSTNATFDSLKVSSSALKLKSSTMVEKDAAFANGPKSIMKISANAGI
jgi:hypothetical protein